MHAGAGPKVCQLHSRFCIRGSHTRGGGRRSPTSRPGRRLCTAPRCTPSTPSCCRRLHAQGPRCACVRVCVVPGVRALWLPSVCGGGGGHYCCPVCVGGGGGAQEGGPGGPGGSGGRVGTPFLLSSHSRCVCVWGGGGPAWARGAGWGAALLPVRVPLQVGGRLADVS